MLKKLLTAIALVAALPVAAQFYESKRVSAYDYECQSAEGKFISGHQRPDTARAACEAWSIENGLAPFRIEGGAYSFVPTALAQQVGIGSGIPDSLGIPVWSNIAVDPISVQVGDPFSLDLSEHCSVPDAFGNDTGAVTTFALVSGSVTGLSLSVDTYSGTPTDAGESDLVFRCTSGGRSANQLVRIEVLAVPVSSPVLGQPVVISDTEIDIQLAVGWDSENTPITYSLERSSSGPDSGFTEIASGTDIFDSETGYSDTELSASTPYWYRTIGTDTTEAQSPYSDPVTATTQSGGDPPSAPGAPSNISIGTVGANSISNITWTPGSDADYTRVIVAVASGDGNPSPGTIELDTTTEASSWASVTGLSSSQWYYLRLCSGNITDQTCANRVYFETASGGGGGSCEMIFGPWDHASESVGAAQSVSGRWTLHSSGGSTLRIESANPIIPGEKYFQSSCDKSSGCTRSERVLASGNNGDPYRGQLMQTSGDNLYTDRIVWYAFLMRVDQAGPAGLRGFLQQWHGPNGVSGVSHSPHHGLRGRGDKLAMYWRERENNAPQGDYDNFYFDLFDIEDVIGVTHAYLYRIRWDGRTSGNQGIFELYVDDEESPRVSKNGERNIIYGLQEMDGNHNHPYYKNGLYIVDTGISGVYQQSHTRQLIGHGDCEREDILDAVGWEDVVQ